MDKNNPPEWLLYFPTVDDFNLSKNTDDWIYRGKYYHDFNPKIPCNKCEKGVINVIIVNSNDPHGVGKCNFCSRVHWLEVMK